MKHIEKFDIKNSIVFFLIVTIVFFAETHFLVPYCSNMFDLEIVVSWFIIAGLGMFLPLILFAIWQLKKEGLELNKITFKERLRFQKLNTGDLVSSVLAIIFIGIFSSLIIFVMQNLKSDFSHQPSFMIFEPLNSGRYWILLVWIPYWILNIFGEEFIWRGVIFPKQELILKEKTWIFHGICWGIFHIPFGMDLLITLIPILFIQSYVIQKRRNSWCGVIIHAGLNGPGFILIALGII